MFRIVEEEEKGLAEMGRRRYSRVSPSLPPFQLAGLMELWIQDGDDVRLSLPCLQGPRVSLGPPDYCPSPLPGCKVNQKPLLSLRIICPTSVTSSPSMSPNDKLKLKHLAPGLVELSSRAASAISKDIEGSHGPCGL